MKEQMIHISFKLEQTFFVKILLIMKKKMNWGTNNG